jgi:hypothetical protein
MLPLKLSWVKVLFLLLLSTAGNRKGYEGANQENTANNT